MESPAGCPKFDADFQKLETLVEAEIATTTQLENTLREIYVTIFGVDMHLYDADKLRAAGTQPLWRAHNLKVSLRDRIGDWAARGLMSREAERALRDTFRAVRYATDMLGEMLIGYDDMSRGKKPFKAFTGPHYNTLLHPSLPQGEPFSFRSGDILLVRGIVHNSAAIARIGDVDSQFSHIGIVHIDERGRKSVVEALIADGATISNFDYALAHSLARAVVFRHPDAELAAMAAHMIHDRVLKVQKGWGDHIYYDFSMEPEGYEKLFCAKLVKQAFDLASQGLVCLPMFPTTFKFASKDFLGRIGVTTEQTFAPGDMELEPGFVAVAEWRDYRKTSLTRLQDMILAKMFEWMERKDYRFRETFGIWLVSVFGKLSGYLPGLVKWVLSALFPKIPSNMRRETVAVITMLHKTAQPLLEDLQELEREETRKNGRPLHPKAIYAYLDRLEANSGGRIGYLRRAKKRGR
jgi:hypothetical protein